MEFSTDTQVKMAKYNLTFQDVIFARLLAAGTDPADAFAAIYKPKGKITTSQAKTQADEIIRINPSIILLTQELNRRKPGNTQAPKEREITKEEKERFTTRKGIIEEMIKNLSVTGGKEALQGIQVLAKIQGLDKPDEKEEEEKRKYFLPWVSHCRSCKLMQAYKSLKRDI